MGGFLTESVGWRWIFLLNPIVGVVAVGLTYAFVRESSDPQRHRFDLPGQLMFILGIGALTFALVQAPVYGFSSALIIGLLVAALGTLAFFAWFELRSRDPMMDVRVFRHPVYTARSIAVFSVLFCVYGTLLVITQYFQNVRDFSPDEDRRAAARHLDPSDRSWRPWPGASPRASVAGARRWSASH